MPRRILIIPDKFKGTLTADQAAQAIAQGWKRSCPNDQLTQIPMSDGGDGFGPVFTRLAGGKSRIVKTVDAAHRPCRSRWWYSSRNKVAIVETAQCIGLAQLPPGIYHPFELDTFGLGKVLKEAARFRPKVCLVGIGGSATNDAGFGLARALGWRFFDAKQREITQWTDLAHLDRVKPPQKKLDLKIIVATDVENPFLGPRGATRVYGPQKGIRPEDIVRAEKALLGLSKGITGGRVLAKIPGSGAAGGLGFGLLAFAGARLVKGFDLFQKQARLKQHLLKADLVITGEGSIDRSSIMGKGVGEAGRLCRRNRVPCLALCGVTDGSPGLKKVFTRVHALVEITSMKQARERPAQFLEQLAARIAERGGCKFPVWTGSGHDANLRP